MPILGICSLQAIGGDSRHVASLTFYPGICRAENFSTAETQYHSSSISFYVHMYKYTLTPPPPLLLPHLTPHCTHHYKVHFLFLENFLIPFHSTINLCVPSILFLRLARLYLRPVPSCGRQTVYIRKCMYINWRQLGIQSSSYHNIRQPRHIAILLQILGQLALSYPHTNYWARSTRKVKFHSETYSRHDSFFLL